VGCRGKELAGFEHRLRWDRGARSDALAALHAFRTWREQQRSGGASQPRWAKVRRRPLRPQFAVHAAALSGAALQYYVTPVFATQLRRGGLVLGARAQHCGAEGDRRAVS
jgi:hypothetical protein